MPQIQAHHNSPNRTASVCIRAPGPAKRLTNLKAHVADDARVARREPLEESVVGGRERAGIPAVAALALPDIPWCSASQKRR